MEKNTVLSVIVPVHNEEQILKEQALKLIAYTRKITNKFEVVFVENGSTDRTMHVINELQRQFNFVRAIKLPKADYSTAVIEGIKMARGEFTIVLGIDFVDIDVVGRCFNALKNADIVICSKNKGIDKRSLINRLANLTYNVCVKLIFGLKYSDVEGYHGYRTEKIQSLIANVHTRAHLCNLWILVKAKKAHMTVDEIPMIVYEQRRSKFMRITRLPYLVAITLIEIVKLKCNGF
ncbi:MAG: glycosyltransferase family 2 protein [Candidatus Bathyarchaeia archaeon]